MKRTILFFFISIVSIFNLTLTEDLMLNSKEKKRDVVIEKIAVKSDIQDSLFTKDNLPQPTLKEILDIFKIEGKTIKEINDECQKKLLLLRAPGKERWEVDEIEVENKEKVLSLFKELGYLNEIKPILVGENVENKIVEVDFFVLGATIFRLITRTETLIKTYKELENYYKKIGAKFKVRNIVYLGSERKRDIKIETDELFTKEYANLKTRQDWKFNNIYPETELEMCKFVFNRFQFPKKLIKNANVIFVCAGMQKNPDGTMRRANTGDTINESKSEFNKKNMKFIKSYFFSNNPYVGYQDSVVRFNLPEVDFQTIGDAVNPNEKISILADTLFRHIYSEYHRRNQN